MKENMMIMVSRAETEKKEKKKMFGFLCMCGAAGVSLTEELTVVELREDYDFVIDFFFLFY